MQVNFTGIKNIGGISKTQIFSNYGDFEAEVSGQRNLTKLAIQLDNKGTRDLYEFEDVFRAYPSKNNCGFLNLEIFTEQKDYKKERTFLINGHEVNITDDKLPILSKIAKLVTKVANLKPNQYNLNSDYLDSEDALGNMFNADLARQIYANPSGCNKIKKTLGAQVKDMHTYDNVVNVANSVNKKINKIMMDYFA